MQAALRGCRREIDLIVERADQCVIAFEVELSRTVVDEVESLLWLREQIGDGVAVIPAALLGM